MTATIEKEIQTDVTAIEEMIGRYVKAIDSKDMTAIKEYLHPDFRVVAGNAASLGIFQVISKDMYLDMLASGKIGGMQREVTIEAVSATETTATAFVRLENEQKLFLTFYSLIKQNEQWFLISDMPILKNKQ